MKLHLLGVGVLVSLGLAAYGQAPPPLGTAQRNATPAEVPAFEFDPTWPKPLPNKWILGDIAGMHVDDKDQIWVLQRGNTVPLSSAADYKKKGGGDCCAAAPAFLVFNMAGDIVKSWGGQKLKKIIVGGQETETVGTPFQQTPDGYDWPREHGLFVDAKGFVWTGCDQGVEDERWMAPTNCGSLTKLTNDGKVIWQKGRYGQGKGNLDREAFNRPSDIWVDTRTREAFVADGYGNKRVAVVDTETGEIKRIWGPYGTKDPPNAGRGMVAAGGGRPAPKPPYDPAAPPPKTWGNTMHCINVSNDGLVYICDRANSRIQVFKRDGTYVKEAFVEPQTTGLGSAFDIAFSPDRRQKYVYWLDGVNRHVHILLRDTLEVIGQFSKNGPGPGELLLAHVIATDSKGNIYVGETIGGDRIQRWKFAGMKKRGQP